MEPKRALIYHPNNFYNIGDRITFLGSQALLTKALGDPKNLDIVQFDMKRAFDELDTYVSQYNWGRVDIIALAGSPWINVGCEKTSRYKLLLEMIERYPKAKKVALGIGSCFGHTTFHNIRYGVDGVDRFLFNAPERKLILNQIYSNFDYILVRDQFMHWILNECKVKNTFTYDTSAYSYNYIKGRNTGGKKKVLVFYDASKGVSREALHFNKDEFIDYQLNWAKKNKADIYCICSGDKATLDERKVEGSFSTDIDFLAHKLSEYDEMLTGRIHQGVLGFIAGIKNITVLPVDSRFMTTLKFGLKQHFIGEPWRYEKEEVATDVWKDIYTEEAKVVQSLKGVLL